eukprot:GHVL01031807.1.p1 GENE.GHVL01031807.1~~GHVL01031807.1.p1  ORF type:complete len:465 (+),score=84.35 GHVL01031807.1:86-1396(+)
MTNTRSLPLDEFVAPRDASVLLKSGKVKSRSLQRQFVKLLLKRERLSTERRRLKKEEHREEERLTDNRHNMKHLNKEFHQLLQDQARIDRLSTRPAAALPREYDMAYKRTNEESSSLLSTNKEQRWIKDKPLAFENLSHAAPSIFDCDDGNVEERLARMKIEKRRLSNQSNAPFWEKPPKAKQIKKSKNALAKWESFEELQAEKAFFEEEQPAESVDGPAKQISESMDGSIKNIVDIHSQPEKLSEKSLDPKKFVKHVLDDKKVDPIAKSAIDHGAGLIKQLKTKAAVYAHTGVNPDVMETLKNSIASYAGIERQTRKDEMLASNETFQSVLESGRGSLANFNLLIRSKAYQGKMEEALDIHDKMVLHGFLPNSDTYVGLIMGTTAKRDASAARLVYLKMRGQSISADAKVCIFAYIFTQLLCSIGLWCIDSCSCG